MKAAKASALTTYADPAQLAGWLGAAGPGATVIYACGPHLGQHPTAALVRDWADAGKLLVWSDPNPHRPGCKDYKARLLAGPASADLRADPPPAPAFAQSAAGKVYAALADHARRGADCPTNEELAWVCGLKDREAARYRFAQLIRRGLIRLIEPNRYSARVIEIVATGQRTGGGLKGEGK